MTEASQIRYGLSRINKRRSLIHDFLKLRGNSRAKRWVTAANSIVDKENTRITKQSGCQGKLPCGRSPHSPEYAMEYRRLGRSGLKVSELAFGSWVTYGNQLDVDAARECMAAAWDHGVNFFDNAEVYAAGKSEEIMGATLKKLAWPRLRYIVSTKFFWGITDGPNEKNTLNRKYLLDAMGGSLKRLQLEYVDLVYCHRPDPNTPIEETVWAMHDMIARGYALYWGTSEWSAADIAAAWHVAERHHLHKPVVEQPEYNLFHRGRVETEYARLYEDIGMGLTTWMQGKAAHMNPVAVFIGLLFFGWLWGGWGLLLGVPILAVIKSIADRVEAMQPISELLSP